jgi:chemosensory pili system protein ChpE
MFATALTGAFIALSFSAPPGPVTLETIRRGVRGGFGPALHVQLGSIIGDTVWCLAAILGLAPLMQTGWIRSLLAVAGIGVLIVLGSLGIRDALRPIHAQASDDGPLQRGAFRSGLAISMANPMAVGYWLSVSSALVAAGLVGTTPTETFSFITGFLGGTFAWAFLVAFAVRWARRVLTPAVFQLVTLACGLALLVFGVMLASQMLNVPA